MLRPRSKLEVAIQNPHPALSQSFGLLKPPGGKELMKAKPVPSSNTTFLRPE